MKKDTEVDRPGEGEDVSHQPRETGMHLDKRDKANDVCEPHDRDKGHT